MGFLKSLRGADRGLADYTSFCVDFPGRESNPGLARDRRGYSPLYYRGLLEAVADALVRKHRSLGDGTFLVRESLTCPGDFTLVYLFDGHLHRSLIKSQRHYGVNVFYMNRNQLFNSLSEIVDHYRKTPLKTPHFEVLLKRPCPPWSFGEDTFE
ncbi:hypothetical protein L596_006871 [Steinernema carpocapsae]|uniref:SH2 domain-containing protein n=1 Tax=Steinernema carpocapsae TaxID=34508 RepID=A0A4U5P7B7_STECR|nr:hypothetical protein L596_006871 [Steinernema carpocapsae]